MIGQIRYLCIIINITVMIQDNEFDSNAQDIDAFCASHDIDDYDLFGEIMVGDNTSYDELSDNILYE